MVFQTDGKKVTHETDPISGELKLKLSRSEYIYPQIDHKNSSLSMRQKGLTPSIRTQLFLTKNDLFPSRGRLLTLKKSDSSICFHCSLQDNHAHFIFCNFAVSVTQPVLSLIRDLLPNISDERIANIDLEAGTEEGVVSAWTLGTLIQYIWECKICNSPPLLAKLVGRLRANLQTLRAHSPLVSRAALLESMMDKHLLVLL